MRGLVLSWRDKTHLTLPDSSNRTHTEVWCLPVVVAALTVLCHVS